MSTPAQPVEPETLDRYVQTLKGLPALLDVARTILTCAFPDGNEEADDLLRRIEECAVDAHRLLLAHQIDSLLRGADAGRRPGS